MAIAYCMRSLRFGLVVILSAAWLWSMIRWRGHPNGAGVTLMGLLGFAGLGLAAWIAPIEQRSIRITIRVFGAIVGVVALGLFAWLEILLRNGL